MGAVALIWALAAAAIGAAAPTPAGAPRAIGPNASIARWSTGSYEYRAISDGGLRGRESFYLTVAPDGSRLMRAFTDIFSRGVQANAVLRASPGFRPLQAYVSISTGGKLKGNAFYTVSGTKLDATVVGPDGAVTHARTDVPENFSFVTHPLALDGWHAWYLPAKPGALRAGAVYLINGDARNDRPMLGELTKVELRYVARETMTVPAGTFDCDHFNISGHSDIWVTGPDRLLVRYVWKDIDRDYRLETLARGENRQAANAIK